MTSESINENCWNPINATHKTVQEEKATIQIK